MRSFLSVRFAEKFCRYFIWQLIAVLLDWRENFLIEVVNRPPGGWSAIADCAW
jgi:hypothetical protein